MPGIALLVIAASPWIGAGIGAEEVPPGWAARFSGGFGAKDVTTHAEHAAFALKEGETLHPEVAADGFVVQYEGELRIARKGKYRFGLDHAGGTATLTMMSKSGGARLGHVAVQADEAELSRTDWIEIEPGTLVVNIKFTRAGGGPARLRTSWEMERDDQGNGFVDEPIPARLASVPSQKAGAVARDLEARQGRVLLSELGCTSCHDRGAAANAVDRRAKSSLERVASRASEAWLRRWIAAPQELDPGCGMPAILGSADPAKSKSAADALVELLLSLTPPPESGAPEMGAPEMEAPPPVAATSDPLLIALGDELYHAVGCVGCHGPFEAPAIAFRDEALSTELPAVRPPSPFGDLAGKWNVSELAAFLRDPRATRPHARMPALDLSEPEAAAIASALVEHFGAPAAPEPAVAPEGAPAVAPRVADPKKAERGRFLFNMIGCANCHVLGAGVEAKAAGAMAPLTELRDGQGCLAIEAAQRGMAPRYVLDDAQRAALSAGLASAQRSAAAAAGETPARAPLDATQRALAAFHCTACHERDKQGGPAQELLPYYRSRVEADLGDEGHLPPRLDGVGLRLQSPWLARVVGDGARARPYFWTRMPAFGAEVGGEFAAGLAALEGEWRSDETPAEPPDEQPAGASDAPSDEALAIAGRRLAGTGGLNCVTCHSFGERPSAGTPGLDFIQLSQRIRREWWQRYAFSPLRFKPGTRMPTFFENGKSAAVSILDGDATRQVDALWHWFEQAGAMPAPEGVPTGERMVLAVGDRPKVFRTFLERAGSRGIAVGFPDGLHFAFDAEQIRLCEAWSGEFLDVAPVWNGRGGNVAPQLGPVVWSAPPGPALLLEKPQGEWPSDSGRNHGLKFKGYRLDANGAPTFLWELRKEGTPADDPPQPDAVQVEETFRGDPRPDVLFVRTFRVSNLPPGASIHVAPGTESATARDAQPLVLEFEVKS